MDFSILTPKVTFEFILRWAHFLGGITWIGLLYWFNLINVNFQKSLDADLKPKVNPHVIPQTLFYFRWAAVVTFLTGFIYYISILTGEVESGALKPLFTWLVVVGVSYTIMYFVICPKGILNNGFFIAGLIAVLVLGMAAVLYKVYTIQGVFNNSSYMIGIGGGIGTLMLLNVWGIIWPVQKRLLGLVPLKEGQDKVQLARRAFLASRTNLWLSIPMLFFMGASTHLPLIYWGY